MASTVIPRLIHRVWLGPKPIPPESDVFWVAFAKLHPGWTFRTWTDAEDYSWLSNRSLFERASTWTSRSDVLRFELLCKYGGIYVDVDVEPRKSFEPLLEHGAFAGYEDRSALCGAVMGAEAGHPAITALIEALPGWVSGRANAEPHEWAGPRFLTAQWTGRDDVTLLPPAAFYPKHWAAPRRPVDVRQSYAIHHWSKNWSRVTEPRLSILMAWTDKGDAYRTRVKDWVERYWRAKLPEAEFIIGTDGGREPFNRSACFNDAASSAKGDVFFCTDADLCLDPKVIQQAVELVHGTRAWVVPWYTNFRLTHEATLALIDKDPSTYRPPPRPTVSDYRGREAGIGLQFGGGCEIVPRAAWDLVGGMPEAFEGWGSEDIGFSLALDTLWGPHLVPPVNMIHLFHERPPRDTMNPGAELAYWEANGKPEQMRELVARQSAQRGWQGRTAPTGGVESTVDRPLELPPPVLPRGWYSSANLNRRPGVIPKHRERYLRGLMVPV